MPALAAGAAVRSRAAAWIAGQVSGYAMVACDPGMCAALQAQGIRRPAPALDRGGQPARRQPGGDLTAGQQPAR